MTNTVLTASVFETWLNEIEDTAFGDESYMTVVEFFETSFIFVTKNFEEGVRKLAETHFGSTISPDFEEYVDWDEVWDDISESFRVVEGWDGGARWYFFDR